jgi:hypothetical protein
MNDAPVLRPPAGGPSSAKVGAFRVVCRSASASRGECGAPTRSIIAFFLLFIAWVAPAYADASLYSYIESHVDPATGTLNAEALTLPDEPATRRYSRIRWVPGALEGLGTRHMKWDGSEKASRAARLLELIATGNEAAVPALYDLLRADDVVTFYNDALDLAATRIRNPEPELHDMARRLATESADRGAVKFGIAMLGSFGDEHDLQIVQTLALHDEFGLYAAEAIAELAPDRQHALYDMARKLTGWGRIEAVSRMIATTDPTLRRWLLTEGFRNTVTPQYLAYQCATIADLAGALRELPPKAPPDLPLLVGAADLIQALVEPGPAAGISKYEDAPQLATAFLQTVQKRRESVTFYLAAMALRDHVATLTAAPEQSASGAARWTSDQMRDVTALATRIVNDPSWHRRVVAAILDDGIDLDQAEAAAQKLEIKTLDLHLRRLSKQSANPRRWELAFAVAAPADVERLVDLAKGTSGSALEAVLHGIARYPGAGMDMVETSLTNSDERVRRAAVETLVRWGGPYLRNVSVRMALNNAVRHESDEALKARLVALLNLSTLP